MFRKYPSVFLLLFCVTGILLADAFHISAGWFLLFCVLSCVAALWGLTYQRTTVAALCFGLTLCSFSGFHLAQRLYDVGPYNISHFADGATRYQIWGTVRDWPLLKADRTEFVLALDSLSEKQTMRVEGSILLSLSDTSTILQRGDRIELSGVIYPIRGRGAPWGFDYIRYINLKGIFGVIYTQTLLEVKVDARSRYGVIAQIDTLRTAIRTALNASLPPVPAAVASGFLIGETRNIPSELYQYFRDSGTLHLLAVSGSNVATILLFATAILWLFPFSRRVRSLILLGVVCLFTLLAYGEPSVVRASLMAALVLVAGIVERRVDLNNIIASAALLIFLFDPTQFFDAGTQMSFVIAWGLIVAVPEIGKRFSRYQTRWWYRWIVLPILVCVVAQLIAIPILAYYYERITLSGFISNIIIIPLVTAAVIGVLVLLLAYLIWPALGIFVGTLLTFLFQGTIDLIHLFATRFAITLPTGDVSVLMTVGVYFVLTIAMFALNSKRFRRGLLIVSMIGFNLLIIQRVWGSFQKRDDPTLVLFPIPGGTAGIVLQAGSTEADLIISGLRAREYDIGERILAPALAYYDITHIRKLIVRDVEYSALNDLARLTRTYHQDTVWVLPALRSSMYDALVEEGLADSMNVVSLGSHEPSEHGNGYSAFPGGIRCDYDSVSVFFCSHPEQGIPELPFGNKKRILVLSSGVPLTRQTISAVLNSGANQIVCSYLAHEKTNLSKQLPDNDSLFSDAAFSLVDAGWARFNLKQGRRIN